MHTPRRNRNLSIQQFPNRQAPELVGKLPTMSAITSQNKPFSTLDTTTTDEVSGHVPWSLDNPKRSVAEKIVRLFKSTEFLPGTGVFGEFLCFVFGVEEVTVPC